MRRLRLVSMLVPLAAALVAALVVPGWPGQLIGALSPIPAAVAAVGLVAYLRPGATR